MTSSPDLLALVARLEAAKEGSTALDAIIWQLHDPQAFQVCETTALSFSPKGLSEEDKAAQVASRAKRLAPHFTRSVDAALTLVPEGFTVDARICGYDVWTFVTLTEARQGSAVFTAHKTTAPLALCIAALRARLAEKEDGR